MTGKRPVDAIPALLGPELGSAACKGKSPLFDATVYGETVADRDTRYQHAIAICARCPVTTWCVEHRQGQEGVWGGQLFGVARRCACGTPLPDDAPPYRKHCDQACADSRRDRRRIKTETRTVTCACGIVFTTNLRHQRFCTTPCRRAHEYVRSPNPASTALSHCQNCGDPLPKGTRRRNCSTACRKKAGTHTRHRHTAGTRAGTTGSGGVSAPPFTYFGSKQTLAARIVNLLPMHRHYVEPYAGSLAVLLAKSPSPMETVNDLHGDLMTFWRVLRDQPDALIRSCALTPHSRAEHQDAYERNGPDDLERARRVWVALTQGRGGTVLRTGWRHYVRPTGSTGLPAYLDGYVGRMAVAAERLHNVSLECGEALDLIATYGCDVDTLLYVDPPYLGSSRSSPEDPRRATGRYVCEMLQEDDHRDLAAALAGCTAAVVLSGYPSALYDELYKGWHRTEFATVTGQYARGELSSRTEVVWSNRPLGDQPGLWDDLNSSVS